VRWIERCWQTRNLTAWLLLPLSWLFCGVAGLRRQAYATGLLPSRRLPVPVIVVGNITVGGVGKTPLVIWLVRFLRRQGFHPGVVSRGYGGQAGSWPCAVTAASDPREVGDEPVLIAAAADCPVWVGPDRPQAASRMLEQNDCDIILSDDGLQHYALQRNMEILVIDGARRLGNGFCLPAGPLRERPGRMRQVDLAVVNGAARTGELAMNLIPGELIALQHPEQRRPLDAFRGQRVHAVAGIGNPARFFDLLRQQGIEVVEHPFPDHHAFAEGDLAFDDQLPILMTAKDAVKCRRFARVGQWYLEVELVPEPAFVERFSQRLKEMKNG